MKNKSVARFFATYERAIATDSITQDYSVLIKNVQKNENKKIAIPIVLVDKTIGIAL